MKIDIYKSTKHGDKYLSVPGGTDMNTTVFPPGLDPDLQTLSPFKTSLNIQASDHRAGLDSAAVIRDILANGFAAHGATVTVTIKTTP